MEWLGSAGLAAHALALLCGGLVGFSLALTGGGGSILAVPLLIYVVGMRDIHMAIGTSALAVAANAYLNLLPHAREHHVRWRQGALFTVAGIAGALAGSELGKLVGGQRLLMLFAILMIVVAVLMLIPRRPGMAPRGPARFVNARLLGSGFAVGAAAGFFGIGGGFLIVPGLMLATRMPIIEAIGTSLLGVGGFGLTTALNYARSGFIDWSVAGQFIIGGIVGGWLGTRLACRLAHTKGALNLLFSIMIIVVAVYMLIHGKQP